ncbi:hypothetical protein [Candidatus Soleaferrea massiliensis]|uniref:hypothetical protein n=1 Tax=Candidatus Soleaferrea massiliensis TaxID=1470354 RepID=UPI00058B6E27|nr:hypothetical protein [Candidatus Soleaferrea massiliensis]
MAEQENLKKYKAAIIILSVLLILSAAGIAVVQIVRNLDHAPASVVVPDNVISEASKENSGDASQESGDQSGQAQSQTDVSSGQGRPGQSASGTPEDSESGGAPDGTRSGASNAPGSSVSAGGQTGTDNSQNSVNSNTSSAGSQDSSKDPSRPKAPYLELYQGQPSVNQPFQVSDMLPGDELSKYFCVKAYHDGDITVRFRAPITEETGGLSKVLMLRVTDLGSDTVLYDGSFEDCQNADIRQVLTGNADKETISYYKIDAYLDTSVGNEYQLTTLKANFTWEVLEDTSSSSSDSSISGSDSSASSSGAEPSGGASASSGSHAGTDSSGTGSGGLIPPFTGDKTMNALYVAFVLSALGLIAVLLFRKRKGAR